MGKIIGFPGGAPRWEDCLAADLSAMTRAELEALRDAANARYTALEAQEPGDEESEEYDAWLEQLEEIDDFLDDVSDLLEEK